MLNKVQSRKKLKKHYTTQKRFETCKYLSENGNYVAIKRFNILNKKILIKDLFVFLNWNVSNWKQAFFKEILRCSISNWKQAFCKGILRCREAT